MKKVIFYNFLISKLAPILPSNKVQYVGIIKEVPLLTPKEGITVLTPQGLGVIATLGSDGFNKTSTAKVWLFNNKKYYKTYPINSLRQYVVYHTPSSQILPLASNEYRYIYGSNQQIRYRVSNRLNIILTDECKKENQIIYNHSKKKDGYVLLKALRKGEIKLT